MRPGSVWFSIFGFGNPRRGLTKDGTVPPDVQLSEARLRSSIIGVKKDKIRPIAEMFDYSLVH